MSFKKLASDIALELTMMGTAQDHPTWTSEENKNSYQVSAYLKADDGRTIFLWSDEHEEEKIKRVEISGQWPRGEENYSPISYHDKPHSITCAVKRGGRAIAKDMVNRFLPEFNKMWQQAIERLDNHHKSLRQKEAIAASLVEAWPSGEISPNGQDRVYIGRGLGHSGFIEIYQNQVNLELRYITPEQACQIAKIVEPLAEH